MERLTIDCYIFINPKVRATSAAEVAITRRSFWISNCGGSTCSSVIKTQPPAVDWSNLWKLLIDGSDWLRGVWVGVLRRTHSPPALRHLLKWQTVVIHYAYPSTSPLHWLRFPLFISWVFRSVVVHLWLLPCFKPRPATFAPNCFQSSCQPWPNERPCLVCPLWTLS